MRWPKKLIEQADTLGAQLGLSVWCEDEAGPFQAVPHPGVSWQARGHPAQQPHEYIRGGTSKILTLFHPATGQVRLQPAARCTNAVLHPWLRERLSEILTLDLDTGFAKVVVGQQLTPTDAVLSITRDGSGRRDQAALASRMLGGRAMRAALNSGPMRPVVGVRRVMCRPSLVIATSWSRSRSRSTSPHSGRKPALQQRSSSSLRRMSARKEQNTWPRMAASEEW